MKLTRWLAVGACGAALSTSLSLGVLRLVEGGAPSLPAAAVARPLPPRPSGAGYLVDASGRRYETRPGAFTEREEGEAPLAAPAAAQLPSGPDRSDRRRAVWKLSAAAAASIVFIVVVLKRFKPRF